MFKYREIKDYNGFKNWNGLRPTSRFDKGKLHKHRIHIETTANIKLHEWYYAAVTQLSKLNKQFFSTLNKK